jgi:hypothetical protein
VPLAGGAATYVGEPCVGDLAEGLGGGGLLLGLLALRLGVDPPGEEDAILVANVARHFERDAGSVGAIDARGELLALAAEGVAEAPVARAVGEDFQREAAPIVERERLGARLGGFDFLISSVSMCAPSR